MESTLHVGNRDACRLLPRYLFVGISASEKFAGWIINESYRSSSAKGAGRLSVYDVVGIDCWHADHLQSA